MSENVRDSLTRILTTSAGLNPESLVGNEDSSLEELGLESLAAIELAAVVEEQFAVRLPENLLELSFTEVVDQIQTGTTERKAA